MKRAKEEGEIKIERTPPAFPEANTKQLKILITPFRRTTPTLQHSKFNKDRKGDDENPYR
jgi:hypothetical protein